MRLLKRQLAKGMLVVLLSLTTGLFSTKAIANELCTGHFVNPLTDICWSCLFPLSLGSLQVVHSRFPDTKNPSSPLCVCNLPVGWRIGISFGYWEPSALSMSRVSRKTRARHFVCAICQSVGELALVLAIGNPLP